MQIQEKEKVVKFANGLGQETQNTSLPEQWESPVEQREQYLKTLYGRCTDGYIEIRALSKDWKVTNRQWHPVKTADIKNLPINEHIFIGVATRQYGKGGKADLVEITAVCVDVDFKDIARDEVDRRIAKFSLKPSIIVNSGNGYHGYWILSEPAKIGNIKQIEDINKRLANHFGGDKGSVDASHILRLPETYNPNTIRQPLLLFNQLMIRSIISMISISFLP